MKRSKHIALIAMGILPLALTACDNQVYMTDQNRPRFSSKEECERDFGKGKCEDKSQMTRSGTSWIWVNNYYPQYTSGVTRFSPSRYSDSRYSNPANRTNKTTTSQRSGFGSTASSRGSTSGS